MTKSAFKTEKTKGDENDWQLFEAGFGGRENNMLNITKQQNSQI